MRDDSADFFAMILDIVLPEVKQLQFNFFGEFGFVLFLKIE